MKYRKTVVLKDGEECVLKNAGASDAEAVYESFNLTHGETENLLSYPDENSFDVDQERQFLIEQEKSEYAVEICAFVAGQLAGTAGIEPVGRKEKVKHRAEFGISIEKAYWGRGIGRALTQACMECAEKAGYLQIELDVVSTNMAAISLYKSIGFVEYGRNPRRFQTRGGEWQELVLMRREFE
ncbi:MAG: GNAT family N-acetyltransferase [Lachnospiraceae bacterium]|nr:GNAT family N-acetyltransferase [Robinsoniella sp.]MDY3767700.1 GNAT family N-acetyltransferase [Lachnospiraceae bacterium]